MSLEGSLRENCISGKKPGKEETWTNTENLKWNKGRGRELDTRRMDRKRPNCSRDTRMTKARRLPGD